MSRELRNITVAFTVDKPENLPGDMYADDVVAEVSDVIEAALTTWYEQRGKDLLCCEPLVG